MKKRIIKLIICLFIISIFIFGFLYFENDTLQISNYVVSSTKLPSDFNNFKILQLSDLHSKEFGYENQKLIKKIDNEKPDIIVMTGDMLNTSDDKYDVFLNLSKKLAQKYKVYYVVGNHEEIVNPFRIMEELKNIGVTVLDNEKVKIKRGKSFIYLYGMWFRVIYYKNENNSEEKNIFYDLDTMQKAVGVSDPNAYNILLTHNPIYFATYSKWGADLTLSGHMHGGIIRIPFKGGVLSPERTLFPKYDAGRFNLGGKIMIVNRGLGNETIIPRIFNRPEITIITLENK